MEREMRLLSEDPVIRDGLTKKESEMEDESSSSNSNSNSQEAEREKWGSKLEFILACVGFAVAYGNLMRFPYLCMRNGGGAFLIPFFFFMLVCGLPLYYLEVCLGQFSGSSPLFVWRMAPLLKGIGWLMVLISGIVSWYYNTVIAWVLYYLVNSFSATLPWTTCGNAWNTIHCRPSGPGSHVTNVGDGNLVSENGSQFLNNTGFYNASTSAAGLTIVQDVSSAKEFWQYNVLGKSEGLENMGRVQWHLVLALLGAWLLVFCCLLKGIKTVGKVVYVTALLPYILLVVFLVRGLTLPGASEGVEFYLKPKFYRLLDTQVWLDAAVQVFYSLGPTWGGVITMSSYNKFHNNCLRQECDQERDAIIACVADCLTSFFAGFVVFSIIGYMAYELQQPIEQVATSGPGLMFIAYPEAISRMPLPQLWSVLFFIMLVTVGIDTQFAMFETLGSGIVDAFPRHLSDRKMLVTGALACGMFLLGLPFTTNAGIYIYQLIDWYCSSICMCLGAFLELVAVAWYYGVERFSGDVSLMLGYRLPVPLRLCWCIISPTVLLVTLLMILSQYADVTYEGYQYPRYGKVIGLLLALVPVIPLPVVAVQQLLITPGSLFQRLKTLMYPENWRPNDRKYHELYETMEKPRSSGLCDYLTMNLIGRRNSNHYDVNSIQFHSVPAHPV